MGSFETSEQHSSPAHQPVRVPILKEDVYRAAREMVDDLDAWTVVAADDEQLLLRCERKGGLMGGTSTITVSVEGPDGIPSATVNVRSESPGGLLSRDKSNVAEFVKPFHRRVC